MNIPSSVAAKLSDTDTAPDNTSGNTPDNTDHTQALVLSDDQDKAAKRIINFILDPEQKNLILRGYAGTGKSTLLRHVIDSLPAINKLSKIVGNDKTERNMVLSATTNKAAGALMQTTGQQATTVHSLMGFIPRRDPQTHKRVLTSTHNSNALHNDFLVIDEAYMADTQLLSLIQEYTINCKILWVGDPAQLLPVGMSYCPLSIQEYPEVTLETVIRQQADSPIIQLATLCRYAVETGKFFKFKPDGDIIKHVPRDQFASMMLDAFDTTKQSPGAVKTLSWTNKTTIGWNNHVKQKLKGTLDIKVGDYVVVNQAVKNTRCNVVTDQTVQITGITATTTPEGIKGHLYEINDCYQAFMPICHAEKKALLKTLKRDGSTEALVRHNDIEDNWIDLRDEYACTVNKSQGSTYGTVFIDLDDISRCNMPNQLARLLYVSISRPRDKIVFTGDIQK